MEQARSERDLVYDFKSAFVNHKQAQEKADDIKRELYKAEHDLLEFMEAEGKTLIEYEGIGKFSIKKPRLFASCKVDDQQKLFDYLESESRDDLIKTNVNAASLSVFIKEQVLEGQDVPEFINVYYKTGVKLS